MSIPEEQNYEQGKMDFKLWRRLYGYALRSKGAVTLVFLTMILVSVVDVAYPLFSSYAIDRFVIPGTTEGLIPYSILYGFAILLQGFSVIVFIRACGRIEMRIAYDIRQDAFQKLQELSFSYYDKTPVGYIIARVISDVTRLSELVAWSFVDVLWSVFYILGSILSMFLLSWKLSLAALCVLPPLMAISIVLQKLILKYQRRVRKQNSRITGAFNEGIMGAVTTKTLVREDANTREFQELTGEMRHQSIKSALISASFFPIIISLGAVGTCLALTLGTSGVIDGSTAFIGAITAGTLVAFISYSTQLFDPIQQLAGILAELLGAQASGERVLALIDTQPDIVDTPDVLRTYGDILTAHRENWPAITGDITFDHVSFAYQKGETVLKDFSIHVKPGQTIALVGETGAGKSTIINLLCRFYEPTAGRILIDGVDYRERSQLWLQSSLGYVLQTPHLFSGTIRDNIRFGKPEASDSAVREAAKLVSADAFIQKLPKGYDTEVGEGGVLLSTGQKQLISFARVMLNDPRIFVLDEATSSVDTETEKLIQDVMTTVLSGRTSFVVAHRLSTVRNADRIYVILNGQIAQSGTHDELMRQGGYYRQLYTHQFSEEATLSSLSEEK